MMKKILSFMAILVHVQGFSQIPNNPILEKHEMDELNPIVEDSLSLPIAMVLPLHIQLKDSTNLNEMINKCSSLIRGELAFSKIVNLVDFDIEKNAYKNQNFDSVIQSDSTLREIALSSGATHLVTYELSESNLKYHIILKARRLNKDFETSWIRIGMLRYSHSFNKDDESIVLNVRKATWRILGINPPEDRFPTDPYFIELYQKTKFILSSATYFVEATYGPLVLYGGITTAAVLTGYGIYSLSTTNSNNTTGIGFPPDYPEGQ